MSAALDFVQNYRRIRQKLWEPPIALPQQPEPERDVMRLASTAFEVGKTPHERMREAISGIVQRHGVGMNDVMSPRRSAKTVAARQEAMFYVHCNTDWTLPQIGTFFNRDHTTVLHAVRKCKKMEEAGHVFSWKVV